MASEWTTTPVGEFCPFTYGKGLPKDAREPDGQIPVFGSNGVVGHHDQALTDGPTVIIGRKGTVGVAHYCDRPCWPIDTTFYLTGPDAELTRFKYYALSSLGLEDGNADSAVPGLNRSDAHARKVRVPSEDEQRTIARILGTLDDKIELNRQTNETLEAMVHAIFDSGIIASDGWPEVRLSDVIEVNPGRQLPKGEPAPHLAMADMPTAGHSPKRVTQRPFGSGMRFVNGDTLVARITPCLENGKTAYVDFLKDGQVGWGSTEYIVLRSKPPLPREFAYCLARSSRFRDFAIRNMTGTSGRQRVSASALSQFTLKSPPSHVASKIGRQVAPLIAKAKDLATESQLLADTRDLLLPNLISGTVRVRSIDSIAGTAL